MTPRGHYAGAARAPRGHHAGTVEGIIAPRRRYAGTAAGTTAGTTRSGASLLVFKKPEGKVPSPWAPPLRGARDGALDGARVVPAVVPA